MKAFQHAEIHFNLLTALDPKILKLTKQDDEIYTEFRKEFPDMDLSLIKEEELKNAQAKEKWRPFCNNFQGKVEDWNMGSLLRLDCQGEYCEDNTCIVPRIQFLAIEIARNREGLNSSLKEKYGKLKTQEKTQDAEEKS